MPTPEQWNIFWSMGDVNRDGHIDETDMGLMQVAYGSYPGHPNWNPDCDLSQDDLIDADDTVLVGKNYGLNIWDYFGIGDWWNRWWLKLYGWQKIAVVGGVAVVGFTVVAVASSK